MQKSLLLMACLCAGMLSSTAATKTILPGQKATGKLAKMVEKQTQRQHAMPGFFRSGAMNSQVRHAAPAADNSPVATITSTGGWGQLEGEDGKIWFYTTSYTVNGYYYSGAKVTVYNPQHEVAGTIDVVAPDGKNVNDITPFGTVTTKMFDKNANTTEIAVSMHIVGDASNNYQGSYKTCVYHLEDGSKASEFDGSGVIVSIVKNSWTKYQRLLLINDVVETTVEGTEEVESDIEKITIMRPPSWGDDEMVAEKTFSFDLANTYYSEGAPFNVFEIDGEAYYVKAMYTTPLVSGYDPETWDMIFDESAKFSVVTYDQKYNQLDSIAVALDKPSDAYVRMAAFGMMSSKDLSKNYFSKTGNLDYVITFEDYLLTGDEYRYDFDLFDNAGNKQKDICDNVYDTWSWLASIQGESDQMAFLQTIDEFQQIQMVDLPSCEQRTLIPAQIDADYISTNLNRVPTKNGYQYVIKMLYADSDADGNVVARIGWYNTDLTLDHFTSINLGPNAENFSPNLTDVALNPYLFNTTDDVEFLYIAKVKRTDSEVIDDVMAIADKQGNILKQIEGESSKGDLYTGFLFNEDPLKPELCVVYLNDETDTYSFDFYALPFTKFEKGGDGSEASPYLIATAGDLQQVANEPSANYRVANDIDFTPMNGGFSPIESFSGTLDGDGHTLSNFTLDCKSTEAGLFANMTEGAKVSDLSFQSPIVYVNSGNSYVGVLAGSCVSDTITNVHVADAHIVLGSGAGSVSSLGGLVGSASYYTKLASTSFYGNIDVPGATNVGGIAGETRTSTEIVASSSQGVFSADGTLGGIVGQTGTASVVSNCHSAANLTGKEIVGGIVGENLNRGPITNCIFSGSVSATQSSWYGYCAGGIVGSLSADWTGAKTKVVSGCVSTGNISVPELDGTAHRIAGYTSFYDKEGSSAENGLYDNYAAATVTVGGSTVSSTDATSAEGKDADSNSLNSDFFTTLGYVFGQTEAEPWKATTALPILYFESESELAGIGTVEAAQGRMNIFQSEGSVKAQGASRMAIYTIGGLQVASVKGNSVDASSLAGGTYVVVATDANGHTTAVKMVVK